MLKVEELVDLPAHYPEGSFNQAMWEYRNREHLGGIRHRLLVKAAQSCGKKLSDIMFGFLVCGEEPYSRVIAVAGEPLRSREAYTLKPDELDPYWQKKETEAS